MVELDSRQMGYIRTVEQLFLLIRQQGLMVSPRDEELIQEWACRGIPLRVVCRAIVESTGRYREVHGEYAQPPRTIGYFSSIVEEEALRHQAIHLEPDGTGDSLAERIERQLAVVDRLMEELTLIGRAISAGALLEAYRGTYKELAALRGKVQRSEGALDLLSSLVRLDREHLDRVYALLPEEEQMTLDETINNRLHSESPNLGVQGRQQRRRALFEDELTMRYHAFRIWQEEYTP